MAAGHDAWIADDLLGRPEATRGERPVMAVTVSSRPRQEADFRCISQGGPWSGVGEVREMALPAIGSRWPRAAQRQL